MSHTSGGTLLVWKYSQQQILRYHEAYRLYTSREKPQNRPNLCICKENSQVLSPPKYVQRLYTIKACD